MRKMHVAAYCAGPLGFHQSQNSGVAAEWKKVMDMADMPISMPPSPPPTVWSLGIAMDIAMVTVGVLGDVVPVDIPVIPMASIVSFSLS